MLANYLAITLVAAAFLAIGTAISSFFNNQFAAFFATLATLFFFWIVIGWPSVVMQGGGGIFNYLSMSAHFSSMQSGMVTLSDIVYYLSLTSLGLIPGDGGSRSPKVEIMAKKSQPQSNLGTLRKLAPVGLWISGFALLIIGGMLVVKLLTFIGLYSPPNQKTMNLIL